MEINKSQENIDLQGRITTFSIWLIKCPGASPLAYARLLLRSSGVLLLYKNYIRRKRRGINPSCAIKLCRIDEVSIGKPRRETIPGGLR
jgi:hypothetical protein